MVYFVFFGQDQETKWHPSIFRHRVLEVRIKQSMCSRYLPGTVGLCAGQRAREKATRQHKEKKRICTSCWEVLVRARVTCIIKPLTCYVYFLSVTPSLTPTNSTQCKGRVFILFTSVCCVVHSRDPSGVFVEWMTKLEPGKQKGNKQRREQVCVSQTDS